MKTRIFSPGDKIIQQGDEGKVMFFLVKGEVDILGNDEEVTYATLYSGSFFGEIALLKNVSRTANVIARSKCFLLCLHKQDYLELVNLDLWRQLEEEATIRLDQLQKNQRKTIQDEMPVYGPAIIQKSNSISDTNEINEDLLTLAIRKVEFFQFCDKDCLLSIVDVLKVISFQPGEIILNKNSSSIILIQSGIVTSSLDEEKRKGSLIQNEFYGKLVFDADGCIESNEVRLLALSAGIGYILEAEDILKLMEKNPKAKEQIELAIVPSLSQSLEQLTVEIKPMSSASRSFDSQRLMINSGEKRRASVAVWADPNLSKMTEKKRTGTRSKLASGNDSTTHSDSRFLKFAHDKPKLFKIICSNLTIKDLYILSSVCHTLYNEIAKLTHSTVNLDLSDYANSMNNVGLSGIAGLW